MGDLIGQIIWYVCVVGTAALFWGIGVYAQKKKTPMSFWSGIEVKESEITNVIQYNNESGRMWKRYSMWYWLSAVLTIWNIMAALVVMVLGGTVGIGLLVWNYKKIEMKYRVK